MIEQYKVYNNFLDIKNAGDKGRGVFASKTFKKGDLIEVCPVIEISKKDHQALVGNLLENYTFVWNASKKTAAIVLGYGSLYNHSKKCNADYTKNLKEKIMLFKAIKTIKNGEEITIDYGDMHNDLD